MLLSDKAPGTADSIIGHADESPDRPPRPPERTPCAFRGLVRFRSLLAEHRVERPAPPDVRPRRAQVAQQLRAGAAGLFQRVGQDGEAVEVPLLVDAAGETENFRR